MCLQLFAWQFHLERPFLPQINVPESDLISLWGAAVRYVPPSTKTAFGDLVNLCSSIENDLKVSCNSTTWSNGHLRMEDKTKFVPKFCLKRIGDECLEGHWRSTQWPPAKTKVPSSLSLRQRWSFGELHFSVGCSVATKTPAEEWDWQRNKWVELMDNRCP